MAKKRAPPSTPVAGGTPWKGRLRSHHATPPSLPPPPPPTPRRLTSSSRAHKEPTQSSKRWGGAPKSAGRGGGRAGDAAETPAPRAPLRRSPRLAGNRPPAADGACEGSNGTGNRSAVTTIRRSRRLHPVDKSVGKPLQEEGRYQGHLPLTPNPQGNADSKKTRNACKKSEKQELQTNGSGQLTRKRKRGTEGRPLSKRQSQQEAKSLPLVCREITPRNKSRSTIHKKIENDSSSREQHNFGDERLMEVERNNEGLDGSERGIMQQFCGSHNWTEEQDTALRKAYFTARPSPNFWKKVSKMVPGKSAEECLNRVHTDLSTPTPIAPRPRTSKMDYSPLAHFTLSNSKHPDILEPIIGKRTARQKSLAAQKTVRQLLKKHCLSDQAQEADHFSIFETSPTALQLNISFEDSPGTPSSQKKPLSRLKTVNNVSTNSVEPSPAVLKPVKNIILHEKYIDRLSRREGTKRPGKNAAGSKALDSSKTRADQQAGGHKAARNALISEATDFISHFKRMQASSLAHIVEDDDDNEIDDI